MPREIKFRAWTKAKGMVYNLGINPGTHDEYTMQFTGMKDINGVDIYEGDIVESLNKKMPPFQVTFERGCFMWGGEPMTFEFGEDDVDGNPTKIYTEKWATVIGNIFENPDILKGDG